MKTRNAFALRGLYSCIVDFDEYGNPMEFTPAFMPESDDPASYNSDSAVVEGELLSYLDGGDIKHVGMDKPDLQRAKELQALDKERLKGLGRVKAKIERHIVRLQKISRQLFNQIVASTDDEHLKAKGARAEWLSRRYEYLLFLFSRYEEFMLEEWREHEKTFQRECRRQFGHRLRQARLEKGLTQDAIAKKLSLARTSYNRYESGQNDLTTPTIYRIADVLNISLDWLFGRKD